MKTIQHSTQSLRRQAIERYLRACIRIDRQHRRDARHLSFLALILLSVLCLAIAAARSVLTSDPAGRRSHITESSERDAPQHTE